MYEDQFKKVPRKSSEIDIRPYQAGEDLSTISVSDTDHPEQDMGFIARNPDNHKDQWYVARAFALKNYQMGPSTGLYYDELKLGETYQIQLGGFIGIVTIMNQNNSNEMYDFTLYVHRSTIPPTNETINICVRKETYEKDKSLHPIFTKEIDYSLTYRWLNPRYYQLVFTGDNFVMEGIIDKIQELKRSYSSITIQIPQHLLVTEKLYYFIVNSEEFAETYVEHHPFQFQGMILAILPDIKVVPEHKIIVS